MSFPDTAFRHVPALKGLVIDPAVSDMRFGQDHFDELDLIAAEEGWSPGWRMDHDAREDNRQTTLRGRFDQDLWVFAYGSLIWDPAVYLEEYRYGKLDGWHRSFCMRILGARATRDRPGLMAALKSGGACSGLVFRVRAEQVDAETRYMWRREMFSGGYSPTFLPVTTPQGPVDALVFTVNPEANGYLPDLTEPEAARMIAHAEGRIGTNFAYLKNLVHRFECLGLEDPDIRRLHDHAAALREP